MKKLMIAAAIVCAAAMSQAATYSWSMTGYATPDGGDSALNATVYAFDATATTYASIAANLVDNSIGAKALESALNYGGVSEDGLFEIAGSGLTDDGKNPAYASMYAILVATGDDGKQYFYGYEGFDPVKITDAVVSGGAYFEALELVDTGAIGGAGWTQIAAVPEPTSGLLLLLGVAGLALRRRRA